MTKRLLACYSDLPRALRVFLLVACALTISSLLSALIWRVRGYGLPYSAPYYFVPGDLFQDFQAFRPRFRLFGTDAFFTQFPGQYAMYPAPLLYPIALFMRFQHPIREFLLVSIGVVIAFAAVLFKALRSTGINSGSAGLFTITALLTSYPVLFLIQRGNLEILIWVPVSLGLILFIRKKYGWAAVAFGLAVALKLYPFMFLSLLVVRRRFKEVGIAVLTALAVTTLSLWELGPSLAAAFRWNSIQLQAFGKYFAASEWALGYDHSFFSLVKLVTLSLHPDLTPFVRTYTISAAALGILIFVLFLWRIPQLNHILVVSILSVTIPPVSYDYTLLSLYVAFGSLCVLAIEAERVKQSVTSLTTQLILMALVLTPESYVIFSGARYGAQLRTFCLIGSGVLALRYPLTIQNELES